MEVTVQKVKSMSETKWSITAEDPTGGIMHFGLEKKYGKPEAGDEITLHFLRGIGIKVIGMDLNGKCLYRKTASAAS